MSRKLKWASVTLAALFILIQFVRPAKTNPLIDETRAMQAHVQVTPEVAQILERACQDCHSNQTEWPWYSNVAPVSWLVIDHVNHGRRHLNFSDWAKYDQQRADELLENICEWVQDDQMPLKSYTLIHRDAKLSPPEREALCRWANAERQRLAANR